MVSDVNALEYLLAGISVAGIGVAGIGVAGLDDNLYLLGCLAISNYLLASLPHHLARVLVTVSGNIYTFDIYIDVISGEKQ